MNADLQEAKRRLPLPDLMAKLGHGDGAKKSARCPFHEDSQASFSVFQGVDGGWKFKCFAGCGEGDAIDYLALARGCSKGDAIREFVLMAGMQIAPQRQQTGPSSPASHPAFDWGRCVAAFTSDHQRQLAEWRRYSLEFVAWLHQQGLVGLLHGQHAAFPVHSAAGPVIACHYRMEDPQTGKARWSYFPAGLGTHALVIGAVSQAKTIWAFESQWDAFAAMDKLGWHTVMPVDHAAIITRGASNGRLVAGLCRPDAVLYGFIQNDPPHPKTGVRPGEKWLADVAAACGCRCLRVQVPSQHKDVNEFTQAGAFSADLQRLIDEAVLVNYPGHSTPDQVVLGDVAEELEELPTHEFPLEALPCIMAKLAAAVSRCERVPAALPAVCVLGIVSAAIGKGLCVASGPHRVTRGNLYLLASAESGSGKSETFRQIALPLTDYQTHQLEVWKQSTAPKLQAEIRVLDKEITNHERKVAKTADPGERSRLLGEMEYKIARHDELTRQAAMPCIIAQDVTMERLAVLLLDNKETMFSASADARKLVENLLGRYNPGKTTDESLYLSAYSGDFVRVDRQGRDPVVLHNPCLALCWFLQPDMVATMLDQASLSASGFLPRLLLCHTQATPQKIEGEAQSISEDTRLQWGDLVTNLISTYHKGEKSFRFEPTPEARLLLDSYHNQIVDRRTQDLADVGSFAARYAENAWRLAVVLHAALHGAEAHLHPLHVETAENAIAIMEWFVAQQLNILARTRRQAARNLEAEVFDLLRERAERQKLDFVTGRDVHRARIVPTAAAAASLLERMHTDGLLSREEIRPAHGGKTSLIYREIDGRGPIPG